MEDTEKWFNSGKKLPTMRIMLVIDDDKTCWPLYFSRAQKNAAVDKIEEGRVTGVYDLAKPFEEQDGNIKLKRDET